jgi:signal transduction histidine kinase
MLGLAIGITEVLNMLLVVERFGSGTGTIAVIDTGILMTVSVPLLYLLSYRPQRKLLDASRAAREKAVESESRLTETEAVAQVGNWELDTTSGEFVCSRALQSLLGCDPVAEPITYENFLARIHEEDRDRVRAAGEHPDAGGGGERWINYRVVLPGRTVRQFREGSRAVLDSGGEVRKRLGIVQDVTERTVAQERLQNREELLETLVSFHARGDQMSIGMLSEFAMEEMVRLTRSAVGYLCFYDEEKTAFSNLIWSSRVTQMCRMENRFMTAESVKAGLAFETIRRRRAIRENDPTAAARERGLPPGHLQLARHLSLPIISKGRIVAVVTVGNKAAPYNGEDESALALLGRGLWDIAVRRQREEELSSYQRSLSLLVMRLQVVEEEERQRIASELHDTLVQDLAAARLQLAAIRASEESCERAAAIQNVMNGIEEMIGYSRALTYELSSPLLHQFGIEAALPQLAEYAGGRFGLEVHCLCDKASQGIDKVVGIHLYRIVQELLRNVVKHAEARSVTIRLAQDASHTRLEVRDDGRGFRCSQPRSGATENSGFGLFSIRERLGKLGGTMQVETAPGEGARVIIQIPLQPEREVHAP